jgi:hypothetical protein
MAVFRAAFGHVARPLGACSIWGLAEDPPLHSWYLEAFECLDGAARRLVRMVLEKLAKGLVRLGLQDRIPSDWVGGVATGLDHFERGAQVDDGVAGLLGPGHPGIHPRLCLLRRALSHLLTGCGARSVEHDLVTFSSFGECLIR